MRTSASFRSRNASTRSSTSPSTGPTSSAAITRSITAPSFSARSNCWRAELASWMRLTGGVDLQHEWGRLKFDGPQFTQLEGNPDAMNDLDSRKRGTFDADLSFFRPATYVETAVRPRDGLELIQGRRTEHGLAHRDQGVAWQRHRDRDAALPDRAPRAVDA